MRFLIAAILFLSIYGDLCAGSAEPVARLATRRRILRLDQPVFELASAFQRKIVSPNTPFKYRVATQMLTYKSPGFFQLDWAGGTFSIRNSVTFLAESLFKGPETHYFGITARPSLEWWPKSENYYLFFSPGGGLGAIDSRGIAGGQGQDFTFNILVDAGVGIFINDRAAIKLGVQYHHLSNGGQTDPNPGLNLFGPQLGVSLFF